MNLNLDVNTAPCSGPQRVIPLQQQQQQQGRFCEEKQSRQNDAKSVQQRRLWWQKSIVLRSLSSIESEFENLVSCSPFLQNRPPNQDIAVFHRNEIVTGKVLGRGGFSQVMEVVQFNLLPEISEQCTPQEQAQREYYVRTTQQSASDGMIRYCIKHLQEKLIRKPNDFKLAASDLAIEAATLSALEHENIVSVRGLPIHGLKAWKSGHHDGYFIIMDRLVTTLDQCIHEWKTNTRQRCTSIHEKAEYALQLASALHYIHAQRLLYRDLKPQNIGFSMHNPSVVQLFDFGLCRELPVGICGDEDAFDMSGVGTRRYMAPEIVTIGRYNQKADVYSWSMVFWEILALTKPYENYSTEVHQVQVCENSERPKLQLHWPYWIHNVLQRSWDQSLDARYSIQEVCEQLQSSLQADKNLRNNELYITNHESLMTKSFSMPNSPTGVNDFPELQEQNEALECFGEIVRPSRHHDSIVSLDLIPDKFACGIMSPPPAPKRPPTTFVNVPEDVIRSFELSLSDDNSDSDDNIHVIDEVCRINH
jgi:serine/threonine protein kinase